MPEPNEYKHIRAWGRMMHSYDYYIRNQQILASEENAPIDAIYRKPDGWHCFSDVTNTPVKNEIEERLKTIK